MGHEICFERKETNIEIKLFIILFIQNKYTIISFITLRNPYIYITVFLIIVSTENLW